MNSLGTCPISFKPSFLFLYTPVVIHLGFFLTVVMQVKTTPHFACQVVYKQCNVAKPHNVFTELHLVEQQWCCHHESLRPECPGAQNQITERSTSSNPKNGKVTTISWRSESFVFCMTWCIPFSRFMPILHFVRLFLQRALIKVDIFIKGTPTMSCTKTIAYFLYTPQDLGHTKEFSKLHCNVYQNVFNVSIIVLGSNRTRIRKGPM